ncbi:MAG: NUDIX domain-containing protein [Candidatus Binatia bacterium]
MQPGRFMVATAAVLEHAPTGDVLMLRRSDDADFAAGFWEDISGRMHHGEDPETALRREVREETGIEDIEIIRPIRVWHMYRGPVGPDTELVGIAYWCRTAVRAVRLSSEHVDFRWLSPDEAAARASHPGTRASIEAFVQDRAS